MENELRKEENKMCNIRDIMTELRQPIKMREGETKAKKAENNSVCEIESAKRMNSLKAPGESTISKINENLLLANYAVDNELKTVIEIVKKPEKTRIARLAAPWREKFHSFGLDENELLYMDERLVIPKELRQPIFRSLHWGHPGRDAMLGACFRHLVAPDSQRDSAIGEKLSRTSVIKQVRILSVYNHKKNLEKFRRPKK